MSRQPTGAGDSDWIWVPAFRRCRISEDKVEITHPLIFGRGFLFDRARQVVTIRRCLLGFTLSEEEIPFSHLSLRFRSEASHGEYGESYTSDFIDIEAPGHRFYVSFSIWFGAFPSGEKRAHRVLAAIQRLGL